MYICNVIKKTTIMGIKVNIQFVGERGTSVAFYVIEHENIRIVVWNDEIKVKIDDVLIPKKEVRSLLTTKEDLKGIVEMCKRDMKLNYRKWKKNLFK